MPRDSIKPPHRAFIRAGLVGAIAQIAWVGLYCALTPLSGADVLRQITASVVPAAAATAVAPALGFVVHLAFAVAIAYAFGFALWQGFARRRGEDVTLATAVVALAVLWVVTFFVLLPLVNPGLVRLMPFGVTFESMLLFGIVLAATLNAQAARVPLPTIAGHRRSDRCPDVPAQRASSASARR